jgi:hypothetical protein
MIYGPKGDGTYVVEFMSSDGARHTDMSRRWDRDMTEHPAYMPSIVGNRLVTPAELQRLHEQLLKDDVIEVIPDDMRAVVEREWPELACKLPPKNVLGTFKNLPKKRAFARYLLSVTAEIAIVAWAVVVATAVLWALFEQPD